MHARRGHVNVRRVQSRNVSRVSLPGMTHLKLSSRHGAHPGDSSTVQRISCQAKVIENCILNSRTCVVSAFAHFVEPVLSLSSLASIIGALDMYLLEFALTIHPKLERMGFEAHFENFVKPEEDRYQFVEDIRQVLIAKFGETPKRRELLDV